MMRRVLYSAGFLLFTTFRMVAQDIVLKVEYPAVVTAGEQFVISWTVNAGGGEFTPPQFTGFYKLMGPHTSYSSSTQLINGRFSQQTSYTYTYYLQAVSEGRYVIAPASITIKNRDYMSDSARIEVVKNPSAAPARNDQGEQRQEQAGQVPSSDLIVRVIPGKTELYQGEHLPVTLKLYSRIELAGLNEIKYPDFNGFLRETIETPPLRSLQRENINGVIYGTGVIQQFLLFPQTTGELTIGPVEITVLTQQRTGNTDPFFGDFFASYRNVPRVVASSPVKINVRPLPGTRPADFSGIVGKISLKASISRDSVAVNDALNLKIAISGTGNLRLAGAPVLKMTPDVEVFEPKITDNIKISAAGTTGEKVFEYVLIPRHHGDFIIPSVSYTYFNPQTREYEKLESGDFAFHAIKGSDQSGSVTVYGGVSKEEVKYIGKDIRFIKPIADSVSKPAAILINARSFYSIYGLAIAVFIAVIIIRREHVRRNADAARVKNRKAARIAGKRLREASKCMADGKNDRFNEEILKALWGYLSDKLSIPLSELTRTSAAEALRSKGADEEIISLLSELLDKCEYARFAPSASGSSNPDIYSGASRFIKSVENLI